jgi:hypothetical protein
MSVFQPDPESGRPTASRQRKHSPSIPATPREVPVERLYGECL